MITKICKRVLHVATPQKAVKWTLCAALFTFNLSLFTSCSDFFEQESDNVIYSDKSHLTNWSDTVYSVMGIMNKMQVIADRTVLLGEVRGDLVTLTNQASADLRELANFTADDDNVYNQPKDYYAIINNCNYFIANVDTTLKSNRNENIFMKEYAAVKAFRAWTYLQLVLNYGSVPFVTEPILTKDQAEKDYPHYELEQICEYFLNDLASLPERYDNEYPGYGSNVRGNDSRFFFFPLNIIRGELSLWLGSCREGSSPDAGVNDFKNAALYYYKYISQRNGENSYYRTGNGMHLWPSGTSTWSTSTVTGDLFTGYYENWSPDAELITMIPCDSIRAEGYYSELRNLFNSTSENDNQVSISPSKHILEISESQQYACLSSNGMSVTYAPKGLTYHRTGDLRLSAFLSEGYNVDNVTGRRTDTQFISKYVTRNVHLYRRMMLWLHFAEALNHAGYPRIAYKILERGLSNEVLSTEVYSYLSPQDLVWLKVMPQDSVKTEFRGSYSWSYTDPLFNFSDNYYVAMERQHIINRTYDAFNMIGLHSRGSGFTPMNEYYRLDHEDSICWNMQPDSLYVFDANAYQSIKRRQQQQVDSLLLVEDALELCFEGQRYYDLMRFALRQQNPGQFLTDAINKRNGQGGSVAVNLNDRRSWYLRWGNGKVGY